MHSPSSPSPASTRFIRAATPADGGEIARLAGQLGYPAEAKEISSRLESLFGRANHFIAVAAARENEKHLLGWIAAEERALLIATSRVEIMGLVVDHAVRSKGIGRALVTAVERWATSLGVWDVVVSSNIRRAASHPFYERLGYSREKSQHVYVKSFPRY
jgi:GNAT superfamily N-acetyltransferase